MNLDTPSLPVYKGEKKDKKISVTQFQTRIIWEEEREGEEKSVISAAFLTPPFNAPNQLEEYPCRPCVGVDLSHIFMGICF